MTEMRRHAEKKCRKILQLESNFSPTVQIWLDMIYAYLQLIQMKEGKPITWATFYNSLEDNT
jgi:hypothetical protein